MQPSQVYSVCEINRLIKSRLDRDQSMQNIWLRGEISNFMLHSSGHMYFTLKDQKAKLKCVMFSSYNQKNNFMPKNGLKVIARGGISLYERDGLFQFYVNLLQPDGLGTLYLAFEQLKQRLEAEGLFASQSKRKLSLYPKTVGVITSPTGAVIRDILITLQRRNPNVNLLLYPVSVQGKYAALSIVQAIEVMNRFGQADVLIIGRGGGSLEELWAFNEESVARAIKNSHIPTISAVGHESDFTIADFVADFRAPTPTAAAEIAVRHAGELQQQLFYTDRRMITMMRTILIKAKERWTQMARSPYFINPHRSLLTQAERIDRLENTLKLNMETIKGKVRERFTQWNGRLLRKSPLLQAGYARQRTETLHRSLVVAMTDLLKTQQNQCFTLVSQLDALSPLKVISRGYSLTYHQSGDKLIRSIFEVNAGDCVHVQLKDGKLDCHVLEIIAKGSSQ